jgi:hypothetical protein
MNFDSDFLIRYWLSFEVGVFTMCYRHLIIKVLHYFIKAILKIVSPSISTNFFLDIKT